MNNMTLVVIDIQNDITKKIISTITLIDRLFTTNFKKIAKIVKFFGNSCV